MLGVAGCGDSGDDESTASSQSSSEIAYDATRQGSDRKQIETTMHYLRERFNSSDGEGFCDKLTRSGKAEMIHYGRISGTGRSCARILRRAAVDAMKVTPTGQRPVYISSVTVDGSDAVVRMRGGLTGTNVAPIRLRKEGGEWKLVEIGSKKKYGA